MITTSSKGQSYINNGLKPFIDFVKQNGFTNQVQALELFNEPEWMISADGHTSHKVDLSKVQSFVTSFNREVTGQGFAATVGSAGLKWSCK